MESDAKGKGEISVEGYKESNIKKARLQSTLAALVSDPVLSDVPKKPTLSDVDTLISLELGSAMRISVLKLDGTSFDVAVMNSSTVKDLKLAIRKKINEMEQSKMGHGHISWKHVWRNFCLSYDNQKLLNDNAPVQHFGIHNHSQQWLLELYPDLHVGFLSSSCILFLILRPRILVSIPRGGDTASFTASVSFLDAS